MTDNTGIRNALRKRMEWSATSLSNRVTALVEEHGIAPRDDALYVLAVQHNVDLSKFGVDAEAQRRASDIAREIAAGKTATAISTPLAKTGARGGRSPTRKAPAKANASLLTGMPSFMATHTSAGAQRSVEAYDLLYLIENSVREVITRVLKKKHGEREWWTSGVDPSIQQKASGRMSADKDDPWHTPRGEHPIYYVDLYHYEKIMTDPTNWSSFKMIFKRKAFVEETLHQVNVSRRVVAHMNALKKDDYDQLKTNFTKWMKTIVAGEASI